MKFKNITDADMTIHGVKFPVGKPVEVVSEVLCVKIAAMPEFEQVKRGRKRKDDENAP